MKKTITVIMSIVCIVALSYGFVLHQAMRPYNKVKDESYAYAVEHTDFDKLDEFYIYNGNNGSYFTVTGTDADGKYLVAIIEQATGNIELYGHDEIISEYDAVNRFKQTKADCDIKQLRIGKEDGHPIWEITYTLANGTMGYYIMDLTTGDLIKTIENL